MNIKNIQRINFDSSKLNEKTKSFYLDNKKVKNNKIKKYWIGHLNLETIN